MVPGPVVIGDHRRGCPGSGGGRPRERRASDRGSACANRRGRPSRSSRAPLNTSTTGRTTAWNAWRSPSNLRQSRLGPSRGAGGARLADIPWWLVGRMQVPLSWGDATLPVPPLHGKRRIVAPPPLAWAVVPILNSTRTFASEPRPRHATTSRFATRRSTCATMPLGQPPIPAQRAGCPRRSGAVVGVCRPPRQRSRSPSPWLWGRPRRRVAGMVSGRRDLALGVRAPRHQSARSVERHDPGREHRRPGPDPLRAPRRHFGAPRHVDRHAAAITTCGGNDVQRLCPLDALVWRAPLVERTDLSIGSIAAATGFADHAHLTRCHPRHPSRPTRSGRAPRPH